MALSKPRQLMSPSVTLGIVLQFFAIAAMADSSSTSSTPGNTTGTPPGGTSAAELPSPSFASKALKNVGMLYMNKVDGPAISNFDSRQPNDIYGQVGDPAVDNKLLLENTLLTTYKLNDNGVKLGAAFNFNTHFSRGMDFNLPDSNIRIMAPKLVHSGGFNINQDLRLGLPTSIGAHNKSERGYLRTVQIISYDLPGTRWTVGTFNGLRWYSLGEKSDEKLAAHGVTDSLQDVDMFVLPNVTYQAMQNFALTLGYEFDAYHNYGAKATSWTDSSGGAGTSAGSLGVSWDVTPRINVSPFLNLPLGGSVANGTSLAAFLTAKIL